MGSSIELFTVNDFRSFGTHAAAIAADLNKKLQDGDNREFPPNVKNLNAFPLQFLRDDMLQNPDLYVSEIIAESLYEANLNNSIET